MAVSAHHTRPETAADDEARYQARNLAEALAGLARFAANWLAANPEAPTRFGRAAGNWVGAFEAARDSHRHPF